MISIKDGHVRFYGDDAEIAAELTLLMTVLIRDYSTAYKADMTMTAEPIDVSYHEIQRSCENCRFRTTLTSCSYWDSIEEHKDNCTFWEEE